MNQGQNEIRQRGKLKEMKLIVTGILKDEERARNCDKWLVFKVLEKTGFAHMESDKVIIEVKFEDLWLMPSLETSRRCRQEIQNTDGEYLPTDPQVLFHRRVKEDIIRRYYADKNTGQLIIGEWEKLVWGIQ